MLVDVLCNETSLQDTWKFFPGMHLNVSSYVWIDILNAPHAILIPGKYPLFRTFSQIWRKTERMLLVPIHQFISVVFEYVLSFALCQQLGFNNDNIITGVKHGNNRRMKNAEY